MCPARLAASRSAVTAFFSRSPWKVSDSSATPCGIAECGLNVLVNATPVVDAGPDITMKLGGAHDVAGFDASGARDADNQGLQIAWAFGDCGSATVALTRPRYSSPGTYEVVVQARDTTGLVCGVGRDPATITTLAREYGQRFQPYSAEII